MTQDQLFKARKSFFQEILNSLSLYPTKIDEVMKQSQYFSPPKQSEIINAPDLGNLLIPFSIERNGNEYKYSWSIYQFGTMLKIGLVIHSWEISTAPESDKNREITSLWRNVDPIVLKREDDLMYEWEFSVPNLYSSWMEQETYVYWLRHANFRVLRILNEMIGQIK